MLTRERKELPSIEYLKQLFRYDGERLYWRDKVSWETHRWNCLHGGKQAGTKNKNGYIRIAYKQYRWMAHRIIFKVCNGYEDVLKEIDHINGIPWDNHISNLRLVTPMVNCWNNGGKKKRELPVGVNNSFGKYNVSISRNGVSYYLGTFGTIEQAVAARELKRSELDKEHLVVRQISNVAEPKNIRGKYNTL